MYHKSWILTAAPSWLVPYIEMTRVGFIPIGISVPYLPILVAILHVSAVSQLPHADMTEKALQWLLVCYFYIAYGCVVDDIADQDVDRKVERSSHRPLVRGAVTTFSASLWAAFLAAGGVVLVKAFFPGQPDSHIPIAYIGSIIYPFLKRFTNFALCWLAFLYVATSFGASRTIGYDILTAPEPLLYSNIALLGAVYVGNLIVETIYMHADLDDDLKHGLGSTAVAIQGYSKPVLFLGTWIYTALALACGVLAEFGVYFFTGAIASALTLFWLVARVDLTDGKMCEGYFFWGNTVFMSALSAGLYAQYAY
ncbi:UbiA prenyltransferase family [Aspergillus unguis]